MKKNSVRRRFMTVGTRRIHFLRSGEGPPVVLIHSSPANTRLLAKEIEQLSPNFTVFAFDSPGFGLSDPLTLTAISVADLADATAEAMVALGLPRCPVFGTHTGASIALELGVRHPDRVSGLVLDGLAAFTSDECGTLFRDYFRKLPVSDLGGHYANTWTRFRDQSVWFPWTARDPESVNEYDLALPHSTDLWVRMYYEAAASYEPAYRAAIFHGESGIVAGLQALELPAYICATTTDMLHPHLDRLPALKANQSIIEIGVGFSCKRDLIARGFAEFGSEGSAPAVDYPLASSTAIERQFVEGSAGQLHLRYAGDRAKPAMLLIHDAPGSGEQAEAIIAELAEAYFVIAPDLPGNGESDAFATEPDIDDCAREALGLLDTLGIGRTIVQGIGFGSSVALAIAGTAPERVEAVIIRGLALLDADERAAWLANYAPPIEIEADGAHWYRTWLMLRDSQIYFPWFDRRAGALRRQPADLSAERLHRWTVDVMRSRPSYGQLVRAALRWDAASILRSTPIPVHLVSDTTVPMCAIDNRISVVRTVL